MRPKRITYTPTALDRNGIAQAQQLGGAGNLTLNGTLVSGGVATLGTAQHITVYSAADINTIVFTVTGTDRNGNVISETITGVNNDTVAGLKNFATVTQVAADGAVGSDVEVGVDGTFEGQWLNCDTNQPSFNVGLAGCLLGSAAMTWKVQLTTEDLFASDFDEHDANPIDHASLTNKSADAAGNQTGPVTAVRLAVTAHTSGSIRFDKFQSSESA